MDTLSRLLTLHPVRTAFDSRCVLGAPSRIERVAEAAGVAPYHFIVSGNVTVRTGGSAPVALSAGDLLVLPGGHAHALQTGAAMDGADGVQVMGGGAEILCGQFRSMTTSSAALMKALPGMLVLHTADRRDLANLRALILMLHDEAGQHTPGTESVISHLASGMFSMLLRAWLLRSPRLSGLLALLAEPRLQPALQHMVAAPGAPCSIDQMAVACFLSRSTFLRLFRHAAGTGPAEVLQGLRMAEAEQWLAGGRQSVAQIADLVGYQSEAAFNRAFKRCIGMGPGEYRRRLAQPASPQAGAEA